MTSRHERLMEKRVGECLQSLAFRFELPANKKRFARMLQLEREFSVLVTHTVSKVEEEWEELPEIESWVLTCKNVDGILTGGSEDVRRQVEPEEVGLVPRECKFNSRGRWIARIEK